jgi:mRNA-degrading endonuclease RelE of RelBE toxin-antitoxin system
VARLVLARRARTELLALDWHLIDAAEEALVLLQREPHAGYPLRGRLRCLYSLRVGSYRLIYQLSSDDRTVRAATIRHRSVAYESDPR